MVGFDDLVGSVIDSVKNTWTDKDAREAAIKQIEEFKKEKGKETTSKSVPTEIKEFREAYKDLIKKAGIKRLVVLIDDLDRCLPQTAIETLEAIRLFVLWDKTAFIVGADEGMIEIAVRESAAISFAGASVLRCSANSRSPVPFCSQTIRPVRA